VEEDGGLLMLKYLCLPIVEDIFLKVGDHLAVRYLSLPFVKLELKEGLSKEDALKPIDLIPAKGIFVDHFNKPSCLEVIQDLLSVLLMLQRVCQALRDLQQLSQRERLPNH
jgi:hypothetical protein